MDNDYDLILSEYYLAPDSILQSLRWGLSLLGELQRLSGCLGLTLHLLLGVFLIDKNPDSRTDCTFY